ncbi:MAG: hypothetical protein OXI33_00960, partial [Chloroflexota bacterium]|nr:hypothetical protein [Chloroflexota bacterium]
MQQHGEFRRLGTDRQLARLDAGRVQQVGDEVVHVVGLVLDDAEELAHHRRVELRGRVEDGGAGALDGGPGHPQLGADPRQELGPQPFQLVPRSRSAARSSTMWRR